MMLVKGRDVVLASLDGRELSSPLTGRGNGRPGKACGLYPKRVGKGQGPPATTARRYSFLDRSRSRCQSTPGPGRDATGPVRVCSVSVGWWSARRSGDWADLAWWANP